MKRLAIAGDDNVAAGVLSEADGRVNLPEQMMAILTITKSLKSSPDMAKRSEALTNEIELILEKIAPAKFCLIKKFAR